MNLFRIRFFLFLREKDHTTTQLFKIPSSGHVWMWELDCEESWAPKNWCLWTVVLEKTVESPLDCKEIKPVNPKGNQSWIFIGRTDTEASSNTLPTWCEDQLIKKDPDAGKGWRQEKGTTEDKIVGWRHRLNVQEFEQTLGDGEGQGCLACCSSWGRRVRHDWATELNWTELNDSAGTESPCNAGDLGSIPVLGRPPGEGNSYPFQYPGLEKTWTV